MEWVVLGLWMLSLLIGIAMIGVDVPAAPRKTDDEVEAFTQRPRLGHKKRIVHGSTPILEKR